MILVSGGTGFVGRHLVRQLVADGHAVRVLSRTPDERLFGGSVEWARGDLLAADTLGPALAGISAVVHAAAVLPAPAQGVDAMSVNVSGTAAIAEAARAGGVRRFIHISSAGVYGNGSGPSPHRESDTLEPQTAYERSKLESESAVRDMLAATSVAWTILRPQGLFGAERSETAELFRSVATKRVWLHGPSRVLIHPTDVRDLIAAITLLLARDDMSGEVINVGGSRALEFRELIALIGARVGHTPLQLSAPSWLSMVAAAGTRAAGTVGIRAHRLERMSMPLINRAVSIEKARRLLGFIPTPLEHSLDDAAAALRMRTAA